MRGLYAIVDIVSLQRRGLEPLRFAEAVLDAKPAALQLRDKRLRAREALALLRALRPMCTRAGVPLFANDRPDLALLADCDGVHVGQDDLPVEAVHTLAPDLKVGLSVHNREQRDSVPPGLTYIALGPVFATRSKQRPDAPLGLDGLEALATGCQRLPTVAIGGITEGNAGAIAQRSDCGAVIAALLPALDAGDPYAASALRAATLHRLLRGTS